MNLVRKQSETGCSVDGECRAEEKPYNYKDDPFFQYLAGVVARGRRARTKEGRNKRRRARRANDLDFRDRERARRYGITLEQLHEMYARQNNACAICGRSGCELVIDHDHITGELRGLLCIPCNILLGLVRDDPSILRAAAEYLERPRGVSDAASNNMGRAQEAAEEVRATIGCPSGRATPAERSESQGSESRNPVSTEQS